MELIATLWVPDPSGVGTPMIAEGAMNSERTQDPEALLSVEEAAAALGRKASTVWILAREHNLPRYRIPARGKTTLLKWGDVLDAYNTPRPVEPRATKKAAA